MLVYLDQNHASRIAKFLLGQPHHEAFGEAYAALEAARPCVPPSPFHVLETRGGYLLPTLQELFGRFSCGYWLRPYQEVVRRQSRRTSSGAAADAREDLLTRDGDWSLPASLSPLDDLLDAPLSGPFVRRREQVRSLAADRFGIDADEARRLPFFGLLGRLVAFRSLDVDRLAQPSDLTDLVMAATVAPYVDVLATDRYLRELLVRIGHRGCVFSGRRHEVRLLARTLREEPARPDQGARCRSR